MFPSWSVVLGMLWLLPGITLFCLTPNAFGDTPTPRDWPLQFYALLYQNFSGSIGIMDLYYDWEKGTNLHVIQNQYEPLLYDMEYQNGTILKWEKQNAEECRRYEVGVGILPPNWLKGATYQGTQEIDGFSVNVWTKADFITYREDVVSKRPVSWTFYTGRDVHVISFEPGIVFAEKNWKVSASCFLDDAKVEPNAYEVHRPGNPLSDLREEMAKSTMA